MKIRRKLMERLEERRALIGLLQTRPNPDFAELTSLCDYDFLILDDQHGVFAPTDHLRTLQAVSSGDLAMFVRLRGHDLLALGCFLDMGADGIVVPEVETADEARALVRSMAYPPAGTRGFGAAAHRAASYGLELAAHLKDPRNGVCLLPTIESAQGVSNVEEIVAVDGVDGVIIGPSDLSADLGCPGDFTAPRYAQAVARIEAAAAAKGKILGTAPTAVAPPDALVARGYRMLIMGSDISLVREAMRDQVARVRHVATPA
jgi:2-keto-3-deoxy-L-rhamnonate aldolase RhmA